MRVLHITNAFPYPEVPEYGVFIKEQIESLDEIGGLVNDVIVINGRRDGKSAYLKAISEIRGCAKRYDIMHCHHLYSGFTAAIAMTGKPRVVSFLNDWLYEMDGVSSLTLRRLGCNVGVWWADRVIVKSPIPAKFASDKRFVYLPNGINSEQFQIGDRREARNQLGLRDDTIYLLFVSSKDLERRQKRYDRFKLVLEALRDAHPNWKIEELLLVNQPRDRVEAFFNAADLHLMTSDYEGSPNSVKEALCCGVPVVTTNVGNVAHLLENVPNCHIAHSFDVSEIALLVEKVLKEKIDRESIRRNFLNKNFDKEKVAIKLKNVYEEICK